MTPELQIDRGKTSSGSGADARASHETAPQAAPDAPAEVRAERAEAALHLFNAVMEGEGLDAARAFYEAELQGPAAAPDAPAEVRAERAEAALHLFNVVMEGEGLDAARAFYEAELQGPALAPDAPARVQTLRAEAAFLMEHFLGGELQIPIEAEKPSKFSALRSQSKDASPAVTPSEQRAPLVAFEDQELELIRYLLKNAITDVHEARNLIAETEQKVRGQK